MSRKIRIENIENLGVYFQPNGSGVISGSSQLTSSYDTRYSLSGSSSGISAEESERITNIGLYLFTSSSAGSETLTDSIVKPDSTPNRGKLSWRTYLTSSTITIDDSLPIGYPFILEASPSASLISVVATGSVHFYGTSSGSNLVQSTFPATGISFLSGSNIKCIKKHSNLYRIDGNWSTIASGPAQYYTVLNAAGPGDYETNAITGIVNAQPSKGTWTSEASDTGSDNYMLVWTGTTTDSDWLDYISLTDIPISVPLTIEFDVARKGTNTGLEIDLQSSKGWTASQFLAINSTSRHTLTFYATASSATPQLTIYDGTVVPGQGVKIYEIRITET